MASTPTLRRTVCVQLMFEAPEQVPAHTIRYISVNAVLRHSVATARIMLI